MTKAISIFSCANEFHKIAIKRWRIDRPPWGALEGVDNLSISLWRSDIFGEGNWAGDKIFPIFSFSPPCLKKNLSLFLYYGSERTNIQ